MRKLLLATCLLLASAATMAQKKYQLFEVGGVQTKVVNGAHTFENDTVKVEYYFWEEKGLLSLLITNKTKSPIYVDWEQSSFYTLNKKFDLWTDNEPDSVLKGKARGPYTYDGPCLYPGHQGEVAGSGANHNREARTHMIPGGSTLARSTFYIFPLPGFRMFQGVTTKMLPVPGNKGQMSDVYLTEYSEYTRSPIRFGVALQMSFTEAFSSTFAVKNDFFVAKATEMETKLFLPAKGDSYYRSASSFFLPLTGEGYKPAK